MGNSRFPNKNLAESSSFTQMKTINSSYIEDDIDFSFQTYVSSKACYNVDFMGDQGPDYLQTMVFGGPGGLCGIWQGFFFSFFFFSFLMNKGF